LISLWVLVPIWFIASMALTTPAEVRAYPKGILPFIPFSTETMEFFLNSRGILPGLRNSIIVAVITVVLSILIAAPAGYALSRFLFRGKDVFRLSILGVRAFPIVVLSIPLAVVFLRVGIYDSVYSLALMHTALALPTTILVLGSVFSSIPYELEEAAMVFGSSPFQAFRHVVLPLVMPGIAAAAMFAFVLSWNEVFAATILTIQNRTLPAQVLVTLNQSSEPYQFAGGFFMMIPALIFIFYIRRYLFNMWGQVSK
jgi:multiple sugar transport system permease protein